MRDFKQAYVSKTLEYFKPGLMNKWKFDEYSDKNKPALFFGIYSQADLDAFKEHNSHKILYFGGNDFRERQIELVQNTRDVVCVGYGGDWLEKGTKLHNLPYNDTIINTRDYDEFSPVPLGDKIYVYRGRLGNRASYFKWDEIISPLIDVFGEDRFIWTDNIDLMSLRDNYYTKAFVYVKPTPRGGSTAMHELGFMGRKTITQDHSRFPHTLNYNSIDDIIGHIKNEETKIGTIQYEVSNALKKITEQNDDWLHLNYYNWQKLNNR